MHLVLDSTGLELFGQGEWCAAKHGHARRRWLKLHLGVDATTGEIAAHMLTDGHVDDAAQVPDLLRQPEGALASLTADGAYDGAPVYQAAAARQLAGGTSLKRRWPGNKGLIGPKLRARHRDAQAGEVALSIQVLNRMIRSAKPVSIRR